MTVTQADTSSRRRAGGKRSHPKWLLALVLLLVSASYAGAQDKSTMDIYGFIMLDMGHDFKTIDPNWFDTMRVTKLPSFEGEFGKDHDTFAGIRQTRFGVKTETPTSLGALKTQFEFELFGTGVDEGQTTLRMRHAYGELGQFLAGQTWSPFMDPDVFPNSLEYWGPTGMVFYRNVQFRWTPIQGGNNTLMVALERPGASGDSGIYADRIELGGIQSRFPLPDLTGAFIHTRSWGYLRAAAVVRRINWDDTIPDQFELGGKATGWGVNLSSNIKVKNDVVRLQFVFGEGIQNYMNDSPVDIGIKTNNDPVRPFVGEPLPIIGVVAFLDHKWSEKWGSTIGYSRQDIDNSDGQAPTAFRVGQYALGNVVFYPVSNVMVGGEFQWGRREDNASPRFHSDGYKLQFSFKYNFTHRLGG